MSRYFDWTTSLKRFIRFDTARAEDVNDAFDELSAGLNSLDLDVDRSIKIPSGSAELSVDASGRANKVLGFNASGNPVAIVMTEVPDAVARTGDTMLGPLLNGFGDKETVVISTGGSHTATKGKLYLISANGVTLVAPTSLTKGDYHGVRVGTGVTGFVWDFGSTKVRGGVPGALTWDLGSQGLDLVYEDATRGFV